MLSDVSPSWISFEYKYFLLFLNKFHNCKRVLGDFTCFVFLDTEIQCIAKREKKEKRQYLKGERYCSRQMANQYFI